MPDDVSPDVDSRNADDMADVILAKQQQQQVPLPRPRPYAYRRFLPPSQDQWRPPHEPMEPPPQPQRSLYKVWRDMIARGDHRPDTAEAMPFVPWPPAPDTFDQRFDPERANQADADFDEMKYKLQYADEMSKAGLGDFIPQTGYAEGQTLPSYKPQSGADYNLPGQLQGKIDNYTNQLHGPEDDNAAYRLYQLFKDRPRGI